MFDPTGYLSLARHVSNVAYQEQVISTVTATVNFAVKCLDFLVRNKKESNK